MDPATTFCPNLVCPARGQTGQGNIRIHSCKDKRFLCTECHKTFSATKGTAFYRLRTSAETVSLVVTLLAHGCPLQAMMVGTRLWLGGEVSEQRDRPLIRRLIERVRRCAAHRPLLCCTDGLVSSI